MEGACCKWLGALQPSFEIASAVASVRSQSNGRADRKSYKYAERVLHFDVWCRRDGAGGLATRLEVLPTTTAALSVPSRVDCVVRG
jgi:hypothetical protein